MEKKVFFNDIVSLVTDCIGTCMADNPHHPNQIINVLKMCYLLSSRKRG